MYLHAAKVNPSDHTEGTVRMLIYLELFWSCVLRRWRTPCLCLLCQLRHSQVICNDRSKGNSQRTKQYSALRSEWITTTCIVGFIFGKRANTKSETKEDLQRSGGFEMEKKVLRGWSNMRGNTAKQLPISSTFSLIYILNIHQFNSLKDYNSHQPLLLHSFHHKLLICISTANEPESAITDCFVVVLRLVKRLPYSPPSWKRTSTVPKSG